MWRVKLSATLAISITYFSHFESPKVFNRVITLTREQLLKINNVWLNLEECTTADQPFSRWVVKYSVKNIQQRQVHHISSSLGERLLASSEWLLKEELNSRTEAEREILKHLSNRRSLVTDITSSPSFEGSLCSLLLHHSDGTWRPSFPCIISAWWEMHAVLQDWSSWTTYKAKLLFGFSLALQ